MTFRRLQTDRLPDVHSETSKGPRCNASDGTFHHEALEFTLADPDTASLKTWCHSIRVRPKVSESFILQNGQGKALTHLGFHPLVGRKKFLLAMFEAQWGPTSWDKWKQDPFLRRSPGDGCSGDQPNFISWRLANSSLEFWSSYRCGAMPHTSFRWTWRSPWQLCGVTTWINLAYLGKMLFFFFAHLLTTLKRRSCTRPPEIYIGGKIRQCSETPCWQHQCLNEDLQ